MSYDRRGFANQWLAIEREKALRSRFSSAMLGSLNAHPNCQYDSETYHDPEYQYGIYGEGENELIYSAQLMECTGKFDEIMVFTAGRVTVYNFKANTFISHPGSICKVDGEVETIRSSSIEFTADGNFGTIEVFHGVFYLNGTVKTLISHPGTMVVLGINSQVLVNSNITGGVFHILSTKQQRHNQISSR